MPKSTGATENIGGARHDLGPDLLQWPRWHIEVGCHRGDQQDAEISRESKTLTTPALAILAIDMGFAPVVLVANAKRSIWTGPVWRFQSSNPLCFPVRTSRRTSTNRSG